MARLTRTTQPSFSKPLGEIWRPGVSVGVALLLYAAVVPTHQLTPFILLVSVAGLIALGMLAPRWIVLAMAALVLGYVALNFEFIRENFSIFTGLDPVENAQQAPLRPRARRGQGVQHRGRAGAADLRLAWRRDRLRALGQARARRPGAPSPSSRSHRSRSSSGNVWR